MSEQNTPVVEAPKVESATEAPKQSPAQDLRNIQALLTQGIFPGNVAPIILKSYQLLEAMAVKVEQDAQAAK